jgi:hypothetical protein
VDFYVNYRPKFPLEFTFAFGVVFIDWRWTLLFGDCRLAPSLVDRCFVDPLCNAEVLVVSRWSGILVVEVVDASFAETFFLRANG